MTILETKNLTKHFGEHRALDNVSLRLERGTVFGLLGPNGAGKTTFLRLVNNILVKDAGEILFNGEPMCYELGRHLGYMPEERGLYANMRVEDQILFFGQLHGKDKASLRKTMKEYMDIFAIARSDRKRKVKELSKGNQQKVQIISTIVHEPELIMLDEPFSGFDPINGALLSNLIERLQERQTTIMLSSHNMPAVEAMCTHMGLINKGRLLVDGRIRDVKEQYRENIIEVETTDSVDFSPLAAQGIVGGVSEKLEEGNHIYEIKVNRNGANNAVAAFVCSRSTLVGFREKLPSLSDLFIRFTTGVQPVEAPVSQTLFEKIN